MICQVPTTRPTQTQGHTHHDTVEAVWLGSRSTTSGGGGGKAPQNVTDVFVLISALLLLSFCLSIHRQLIPISLRVCPSVTIPAPIKQACLFLSWGFVLSVSWNAQEILFHGWTNLDLGKYLCRLHQQGVHLCKARCVGSFISGKIHSPDRWRHLHHLTVYFIRPYWPVVHAAVAHSFIHSFTHTHKVRKKWKLVSF